MIEGGAGLTSSEVASLRAALKGNQKSLGCIVVMLDLARYANDWSVGSPLFIVAMIITSPSMGSSALSHAIKRPQHRAPPRPVHFHFWHNDRSNM